MLPRKRCSIWRSLTPGALFFAHKTDRSRSNKVKASYFVINKLMAKVYENKGNILQ